MITDNLQVGGIALVAGLVIGGYCGWHFTAEYKDAKFEAYKSDLAVKTQQAKEAEDKRLQEKEDKARKERQTDKETYDAKVKLLEARIRAADKRAADVHYGLRVDIPASACEEARGKAGGDKPGPEGISVVARIPDAFRKGVFSLADEADRLRLWGEACFVEVNKPHCVCD